MIETDRQLPAVRRTGELIRTRIDEGRLSNQAAMVVARQMGTHDESVGEVDFRSQGITFVGIQVDDSGSIYEYGNRERAIAGHNRAIYALSKGHNAPEIRVGTVFLNQKGYLNQWVRILQAQQLHDLNYRPGGETPLFDRTIDTLTNLMALQEAAREYGVQSRWAMMIISDGEDTMSRRSAVEVRELLTDMLHRNETAHPNVVAFLGLPGPRVDYRAIAYSMGIADQEHSRQNGLYVARILTPGAADEELRHAVDVFSIRSMQSR